MTREKEFRQALAESRQRQAEVSALLAAARAVLEHQDFASAAAAIFRTCKNLIGAPAGYVALVDRTRAESEVVFLDSGGEECAVDPLTPMPIRGLREVALTSGQTVYENEFAGTEHAALLPAGHVALESVLFAPMVVNGQVAGLLGLANKPGGFSAHDARMATAFGEVAVVALVNSRAGEALRDSEERLQLVLDGSELGFWDWDLEIGQVRRNERWATMLGYTLDEVEQTVAQWTDLLHPDDRAAALASIEDHLVGRSAMHEIAYRMRGKDGLYRWILDRARVVKRGPQGQPLRMSGTHTDITERKQAEEALRDLAHRLGERVKELNCLYGISSLASRPGVTSEEILQGVVELIPPAWRHSEVTCARIVLDDEEYRTDTFAEAAWSQRSDIVVHDRLSGLVEVRYLEERPASDEGPFLEEERALLDAIAERLGRITERWRAEDLIRASLKEKDLLLKEIHHRVRNNLQLVSSMLSLQAGQVQDRHVLAQLRSSQERVRALALVHEKLYRSGDLARIAVGEYLEELAQSVLSAYHERPGRVRLAVAVDEVHLAVASAIPLALVVNELLSNSSKHAFPDGREGEVGVELRSTGGGGHLLVVRDDGVGFPDAFDFRTTDSLGLQIVRILVRQIGGSIELDRSAGTRFEIAFREPA